MGQETTYAPPAEALESQKKRNQRLRQAYSRIVVQLDLRTNELSRAIELLRQENAERRRAEAEATERARILENALEGIGRVDGEGRWLSANPALANLVDRPLAELPGTDLMTIVHEQDRAAVGQLHRTMLQHGRAGAEVRLLRRDGTCFYAHLLLIRADDVPERQGDMHCFVKDVSARRQMEQERLAMARRLLQGQKLQALGELAAGVAHEINNPMAYVLSNLGRVREYAADLSRFAREARASTRGGERLDRLAGEIGLDFLLGDVLKAVDDCIEGGGRVRDIVKSLKEFSHADAGEATPADLNALVESAVRLCWNELKYKAAVKRDYGDVPPLWCFPQRMTQVLVNLLVNAAQAIEGRGEVVVRTERIGDEVVVRIRDTGAGIPPEVRDSIFDPFFTTKPVGRGTGLGLHVVDKIVRAHHGRVEVDSEVGKGTQFSIFLPLATSEKVVS